MFHSRVPHVVKPRCQLTEALDTSNWNNWKQHRLSTQSEIARNPKIHSVVCVNRITSVVQQWKFSCNSVLQCSTTSTKSSEKRREKCWRSDYLSSMRSRVHGRAEKFRSSGATPAHGSTSHKASLAWSVLVQRRLQKHSWNVRWQSESHRTLHTWNEFQFPKERGWFHFCIPIQQMIFRTTSSLTRLSSRQSAAGSVHRQDSTCPNPPMPQSAICPRYP